LVWAATNTPALRCQCVLDERGAAFFALGQARVTGIPSVVLCTSGTALCNYLPAVVEARLSGVPLVVLSADRPFELQDCGAPQTIDQARVFGRHAAYHELGAPTVERSALLSLRRTAYQAVDEALTGQPSHLNFRASKPLEPTANEAAIELPFLPSLHPPSRAREATVCPATVESLVDSLRQSERPLVTCGAMLPWQSPPAELLQRFARLAGTMLHLEAVSQLRYSVPASEPMVSDATDWMLASPSLGPHVCPDCVLQLGGEPLSTALQRRLQAVDDVSLAVCAPEGWPDPFHGAARVVRGAPTVLLDALCVALSARPRAAPPRGLELWQSARQVARAGVNHALDAGFSEPSAVRQLLRTIPGGSVLAVGNSLPPRHLDRYCAADDLGLTVLSQRGASGIEGAVAAALGAASVTRAPLTLLVGDLSFLHDVGSLWASDPQRTGGGGNPLSPIVIVVLNNGGGRIFEQLPVAGRSEVSLDWWTSPHRIELRGAAELFGVHHAQARDHEGLGQALAAAYGRPGVSLVEVIVAPHSASEVLHSIAGALEPAFTELLRRSAD
jgi:2-succinyl-5-enolpyruvyl-6-hydroxy-3-cyclohexene-1-carboxylate synthase